MSFIQDFLREKKFLFLLAFPALAFCAGFMVRKALMPVYMEAVPAELQEIDSDQEQAPVPGPAETIMKALSAAYPDRIGPAEFRDEDWAFLIADRWFYYTEGRILPEGLRSQAEEYRAMGFYINYPEELPSWESTAEQRAARTRRMEENRGNPRTESPRTEGRQPAKRSLHFFEALWNISNREEASAQQVQIDFLGHSLTIHSGISQKIGLIEEIILSESETNPAVRQWIDSLGTVEGWNWRNVAGSGSRSNHSYGIAVDLLPKNLGGLATYWLWTSRYNPQWWNTPYSGRYHPPDEVIRAFESFGFIWGGK